MGLFKALALLALGTSAVVAKPYPVHDEELMRLHNATQLEKRVDCPGGVSCGWDNWLCCPAGSSCVTDASDQAQCGGAPSGGYAFYTTTWVETVGAVTRTSVGSTLVGGGTTAAACGNSQSPCGSVCCDSGLYCKDPSVGTCAMIAGGSSGGILPTGSASAPVRPTSSTLVIVTYTGAPTATVPFQTAVPTGASGSLTETGASNGLSGGAIAGIVIGVLLGILILFLICLFCCARALFDTLLGILGLGKKRKHTHEETTYIEDHHHGGAAGGRWYGQGPGRPSRPASEKKSGIGKGMGMAAALGGLALALGLKKKHDRRDDKSTTISGSSAYYSDYTSSSSASSDDRHTRHTRHSSRR